MTETLEQQEDAQALETMTLEEARQQLGELIDFIQGAGNIPSGLSPEGADLLSYEVDLAEERRSLGLDGNSLTHDEEHSFAALTEGLSNEDRSWFDAMRIASNEMRGDDEPGFMEEILTPNALYSKREGMSDSILDEIFMGLGKEAVTKITEEVYHRTVEKLDSSPSDEIIRSGPEAEEVDEADSLTDDAAFIIGSLVGSNLASVPGELNTSSIDIEGAETEPEGNALSRKVVEAMVIGSAGDDRLVESSLNDMRTKESVGRPTYDALTSIHRLSKQLEVSSMDKEDALFLLVTEIDNQIKNTAEKDGKGLQARLIIQANASQVLMRFAPTESELIASMLEDAQQTAARIANPPITSPSEYTTAA